MNCSNDVRNNCVAYNSNFKEPCWVLNVVGKNGGEKILASCRRCPWFLKNNP